MSAERGRNRQKLAAKLDQLDDTITAAQRAGDAAALRSGLRARAEIWRAVADTYTDGTNEHVSCILAGLRDEVAAGRLQ